MGDSSMNKRPRALALHRPLIFPRLHRAKGYLRSRRNLPRNPLSRKSAPTPVNAKPKTVSWVPGDDYLLINSVSRTWNLNEVFHTVRFAHFYTEKEIEARWHSLLFDPVTSSTALSAIAQLPAFVKAQLDREVPFSSVEEDCLVQVGLLDVFPDGILKSLSPYDLQDSVFSKLLRENPSVFYRGRDEFDLYLHWNRLHTCFGTDQKNDIPHHSHMPNNLIAASEKEVSELRPQFTTPTSNTQMVKSAGLRDCQVGGDPESFSDTELLLKETVSATLSAGIEKLTEPSCTARRQHMLTQSSYHGFQALVTDRVLTELFTRGKGPDCSSRAELPRPLSSTDSVSQTKKPVTRLPSAPDDSLRTRDSSKTTTSIVNSSDFQLQKRLEFHRRRRRIWARLRNTCEQAKRWTGLVEIWATKGLELTDRQPIYPTLAALTGNRSRFLINEKEVLFGRSSLAYTPHIDLSLEGDASRISRCHGRIRLDVDGSFWLANFSVHPVFVDGHAVLKDEEVEVRDLATVLIGHLALRFDVNRLYIGALCRLPMDNVCPAEQNFRNPETTHFTTEKSASLSQLTPKPDEQ